MPNKILFLVLVFLVFPNAQAAADEDAAGKLTRVIGSDEVTVTNGQRNGGFRKAKAGDPIYPGDKIVTLDNQTAVIALAERSELILGPSSSFQVETFTKNPSQTTFLRIFYGALRSLVRKVYEDKEQFVVKTPNAVMGVRGTEFIVTVNKSSGESKVHTLSGTVAMAASLAMLRQQSQSVLVQAGLSSRMMRGAAKPSAPQAFDLQNFRGEMNNRFKGALEKPAPSDTAPVQGRIHGETGESRRVPLPNQPKGTLNEVPKEKPDGESAGDKRQLRSHEGRGPKFPNPLDGRPAGTNMQLRPGQNLPKPPPPPPRPGTFQPPPPTTSPPPPGTGGGISPGGQ